MKKVLLKYNNITHLDPNYQHRVMDLGDFYQQLPFDSDFEVHHVTDLDFAVGNLDPFTDWVVVVSAGHCTQDRNLYDKLIIEALKENSPLIGHILNFKDQYPHIHPQLFAFNYQEWTKAGYPLWEYSGKAETFVANEILVSNENFHDDYTPYWIMGKFTHKQYSVKEMQVGAEAIREFIKMGHKIVNVPEHLRKNKFHLYPDQQWKQFNKFLEGEEYTGTIYEQKRYAELIGHLNNQVQKQFYVLNTEPLQRPPIESQIDHYIGVAAGLKLVATMITNGFDETTTVTYFDFSHTALEFQRFIHDHWNGDIDKYEEICNDFKFLLSKSFICQPRGTYIENLRYLLDQIGCTTEEFRTHWQKYKLIKIGLKHLNLYDKADQFQIANICSGFNSNYLWVSNAFWMEYSLITHGKQKLKSLRDNFMFELKNAESIIILDIEDTWHQGLITFND